VTLQPVAGTLKRIGITEPRLGIGQAVDRIVLTDDGRIVAVGTDHELRRSSPLYRRLYEIHYHRETA
jgi:ATP-binding cassette, subfamily B, bacterial MsbA